MIPTLPSLSRLIRSKRLLLGAAAAMGVMFMTLVVSCQTQHQPYVTPMSKAEHKDHEPVNLSQGPLNVRVRVIANVERVTLQSTGLLSIGLGGSDGVTFRSPVTIAAATDTIVVTAAGSKPTAFSATGVWVVPQQGHSTAVGGKTYQGKMRIESATGRYAKPGRLDLMVHLSMEDYLPGVLQAELYNSWPLETFKAQAIAARTYTYFEMGLNKGKTYDLEGTIASQAYAGAGAHSRAVDAVNQTQGVVLMWQEKVLPAFYSSACGGVNQFAGLVLPHGTNAGPVNSVREICTWCKGSKYYRWGPIKRDRLMLSMRIAAWGKASSEPVAMLTTLERVQISGRTPAGRPTQFTLSDASGKSYPISAESFRFACNFDAQSLTNVDAAMNLRSSHCRVTILGNEVLFEQGRGFGHGVGLCQWGAQGLGQQGYNAQSILAFYYPGAVLKKLY